MNGYITLDYELFMGEAGTPEKCLIEPMNHLTKVVDRYGIKMNVFVDAAYLLRVRELMGDYPQLQKDFDTVTNHVKQLDAEGHAIQLHLHPQWCYSTYDGENWHLDFDHYKLSDMPLEEQKQLIHDGVQLLNSLITRKVTAYRAGGYSVENFPELYETFLNEGIIVDSSVSPGEKKKGKFQTFDYRNTPSKSSYRFSYSHKKEDKNGDMIEYPLSVIIMPSIFYLINKVFGEKRAVGPNYPRTKWGDGHSVYSKVGGSRLDSLIAKIKKLCGKKAISSHIEDGINVEKVYAQMIKKKDWNDFVVIGHPKLLSPYSIHLFDIFLEKHSEIEFKLF